MTRQNGDGHREILIRTFEAELHPGDGRTLDVRIVPYDTPATVVDSPEHGGDGRPYQEVWERGAFDKQLSAAHRVDVMMNVEHEPGFRGVIGIGKGTELRSGDDALYGTFRILPGADGDKALDLVNQNVLTGISLEAIPLGQYSSDGVVVRSRAHLDKVALCRAGRPAFSNAAVLAVREGSGDDEEPAPDPPPDDKPPGAVLNPEVDAVLARLGISVVTAEIVRGEWDSSASRFSDEEYEASCVVVRQGEAPIKERASLPVLEPDGALNVEALHRAAAVLMRGSVGSVTLDEKSAAARRLLRYYRLAREDAPAQLEALARR